MQNICGIHTEAKHTEFMKPKREVTLGLNSEQVCFHDGGFFLFFFFTFYSAPEKETSWVFSFLLRFPSGRAASCHEQLRRGGPCSTDSPPPLSLSFKHLIHLGADLVQKISLTFAEPGGPSAPARRRLPLGRGSSFTYESYHA